MIPFRAQRSRYFFEFSRAKAEKRSRNALDRARTRGAHSSPLKAVLAEMVFRCAPSNGNIVNIKLRESGRARVEVVRGGVRGAPQNSVHFGRISGASPVTTVQRCPPRRNPA